MGVKRLVAYLIGFPLICWLAWAALWVAAIGGLGAEFGIIFMLSIGELICFAALGLIVWGLGWVRLGFAGDRVAKTHRRFRLAG